jgi:hypothetical protein
MADTSVNNLDDARMVEKHGRGLPRGSKNKPKASAAVASSSIPTNYCSGRPLGSKNKPNTSAATASTAEHLDTSLVQPILPQSSAGSLFSFSAFVGAQCYEQQRLPLKFTEFMDRRELHEAILREESSDGPPYEVEVYYDGQGDVFFRGGWPHFAEDHDLHQGWILIFNYHCGTAKLDVKIFDGMQCHRKYTPSS